MVGGAAGDDEYLVDLAQFLVGEPLLVEHDPVAHEMPEQGLGHRGGLLGDLFEHEVLVTALFRGGQVPIDMKLAIFDIFVAVEVADPVAVRGDHHGLVLAEFDRLAGVLDEGRDIGAHEHLAVADTEYQRRRAPGGDDGAGLVGVGEHQSEVALEPAQHGKHGGGEVTGRLTVVIGLRHQMHGDLGVGVAGKLDPERLQLLTQRCEVLDDAVVDDGDLAGGVAVRVRIAVGGATVGGPPGVTQSGGARQFGRRHFGDRRFQVGQLTCAAAHCELAVGRRPGRCPTSRSRGTPSGAAHS